MTRLLLVFLACFGLCCRPIVPSLPFRARCTYRPLPLKVDLAHVIEWQRPALGRAFDRWAKALDVEAVFDWVYDYDEADIVIIRGPKDPELPEALAITQRSSVEGRCIAVITVLANMDEAQAELFGTHELGHAMGLGHSDAPWSVMRPRLDWLRLGEYVIYPEEAMRAARNLVRR